MVLARDDRPAVWSHGSICEVRLGLQDLLAIGELERFTCQVEGQDQGLVAVPGPCPDDEAGVFHLFDVDHRVDQPGVAAAQPDDPPICLLNFGVGVGEQPPLLRHLRPYGVVAAGALFFNCLKAELVAVVDSGNPWQEAEQRHRVRPVPRIADLAGHPGHIVVAQEGRGMKCSTNLALRPSVHCSSWKLMVSMEVQMAHHSSYCVTESRPDVFT